MEGMGGYCFVFIEEITYLWNYIINTMTDTCLLQNDLILSKIYLNPSLYYYFAVNLNRNTNKSNSLDWIIIIIMIFGKISAFFVLLSSNCFQRLCWPSTNFAYLECLSLKGKPDITWLICLSNLRKRSHQKY